jgi:hypothetical protein
MARCWVRGNGGRSGRVFRVDELRGSLDYEKRKMRKSTDTVNSGQKARPILTLTA